MVHFSSPWRSPYLLLLLLLGTRFAHAQSPCPTVAPPFLYLEKTSQGTGNSNSTYRLKAEGDNGSGYFLLDLTSSGYPYRVENRPDLEGMSTLISNLVGPTTYNVRVTRYNDCGNFATTTQAIAIPGDYPTGNPGGGGSPPQQEESSATKPHSAARSDAASLPGVMAYPNPTSDVLLITPDPQAIGSTLILLDPLGRAVRQVPVLDARPIRLDTHELAAGLYQLRLSGTSAKAQAIQIMH